MARLIGEHYEGDVRVRWRDDGDKIGVEYHQDIEPAIDKVAAGNLDGVQTHDGLGKPKYEVPVTVAMAYCEQRGIPWEKFAYTNEYDAEWPKLAAEYAKLVYNSRSRYHAGGA